MNNYRITKLFKIILYFFVYISLLGNIYADSYFTIENVEIKLEFDKDKDIRNLAIEKAQAKAIVDLSKKLLSPDDYKIFKNYINEENYSYLVESIEFVDKTITEEYYRGVFNINFNPYKVREYYTSRSLIFSEIKSNEINVFVNFVRKESFFILNNIWNTKWVENNINEKILDLNVKKYLNEKKNLKIVGPEIIDLLDNSRDWNFFISKLGNINLWVDSNVYNYVENIHQIWLLSICDLIITNKIK